MEAKLSVSYNGVNYDLCEDGQIEATVADVYEDGAHINLSLRVTNEEINFVIAKHPEILERVQETFNQAVALANGQ